MTKSNEEIQAMASRATGPGIPQNPQIAAKLATVEGAPPAPPANNPVPEASPVEQGLDPDVANLFGDLAASMDAEDRGVAPPAPTALAPSPAATPPVSPEAVIPPYEAPIHQRMTEHQPESLAPQSTEPPQLEAAIERPIAEEDLRMTADQWAAASRAAAPPSEPAPAPQEQIDPVALRDTAIKNLTENAYALSDEDATMLISEPDKVLPRLAARMHVDMQVGLAQQIAQMLPAIVQSQIQQMGKVQTLENQFFGQYPELNKTEYRSTVQESLAMIRQVNPQATREEVMRDGAALAAVRLRTKLGGIREPATVPNLADMPLAPSNVAQPAPAVPTAPVPNPAAFTPAQAGGGSAPVVPTDPNDGNIFATLAEDPNW